MPSDKIAVPPGGGGLELARREKVSGLLLR
jgi:hypothetical protein